ncbi:putative glycosyltransferase [Rhizobium tropici CIAT 899]|uniref:Alpha-N-acetylglucosamine transferase n=2 Tax=Rhizobium/Agrobacterium group TaxID=227290 RepID=A0A6P1C601_RHITR|nr:putative glycosyltransferase [Rhizobium tropici CIAT 899]MBB4243113.1 alpha-N-acetylglucosamine transferase [Rhizobium tropici]TGE95416.1 glycosyl transferase [Rhizobium sp. SEMIA 4088]MBB5594756.1 alpha-N-acetylglucosamine transferase [Rhizobium tropici]MBB6493439.1 alpha-N-acetylglucosamine transferase [Rhizobium tropici]
MMPGSELLQGLRAQSRPRAGQAFVTLVTNADYAMGALALARSIVHSGTKADIVVLHTEGVGENDLAPLAALDCRLVEVEHLPLSDAFNERHARGNLHTAAPFTKGRKPSFHTPLDNFCKLRLWQLIEYDTCVFIDADALVLRNVDRLFDYPEFSAAPNVYESLADFHRLNSGVFVAKPSLATFRHMLERLDCPDVFWRRTDQTFLEAFFPDWHGLPVFMNMLQYVWFSMPELWNWNSVSILHYQYEKPWEQNHPKAEQLKPLIELWHSFHSGQNMPDIATLANPKAAA